MKPRIPRCLMAVVITTALFTPPAALAPRGSLAFAYGTKAKGLAGGGIALPQDSTAARLNPAGMAFVGRRLDLGMAVFNTTPSFTVTGTPSGVPGTSGLAPGKVDSDLNDFFVPNLSVNWSLDERRAFGLTMYGQGYMGTNYPAGSGPGIYGSGAAGASVQQSMLLPTYAQKWGETASWGVSAVIALQRVKGIGLGSMGAYVSDGTPDHLTNMGYDTSTGVGAKVGVQGQILPKLTAAASYQSKVKMSRFKKYSDLFPDHGEFDLPEQAMAGLAWHNSLTSAVVFDVEYNGYSKVKALGNPSANLLQGVQTANPNLLLGGPEGPGFGWRDVTTFKLGYQWQSSPAWTWRLGTSYGRQPIPSADVMMNILGPSIQEWRFTTGLTRQMARGSELNASLMFAPKKSIRGANMTELPGQQSIELTSQQFEVEMSWAKKF